MATNTIDSRLISGVLSDGWQSTYTTVQASSGTWETAYTTVQSNSATWGSSTGSGLTIFTEISSTVSPNDVTNVHALSVNNPVTTNVDVALVAKGNGATLAQIPDLSASGGNKRGVFATDWQKSRSDPAQVASGGYSTIGGGRNNRATANDATVGGGQSNTASATRSTVGGGVNNTASSTTATVGGGSENTANAQAATVGGGQSNTASGIFAVVAGGIGNTSDGEHSSILGGENNNIDAKTNAHIIGSNITAPLNDYTYVNNLSSQGVVTTPSGNSTQWSSSYTTVQTNSASWGGGSGLTQPQVLTRVFFKV
jgi:hypothetical protein